MITPTLINGKPISEYTRSFTSDRVRNRGERPNIIIVLSDQQRHDTIHAMGFPWARTPAYDRLVREGVAFRNAYSPNPVCIPARHNLLTGLPGRYHGLLDNSASEVDQSLPRLPRLLASQGYHCGGIGKFHFNSARTHHGFHELMLMEEIPRYRRDDQYLQYLQAQGYGSLRNLHGIRNLLYLQPQRSLLSEQHHGTTWVGDQSLRFIRDNANRAFFLQLGFIAPHPPFNAPERWAEACVGAGIPAPLPARSDPPPMLKRAMNEYDDPQPAKIARTRELYHACVWHVDHQIGRLLATLDELGLSDNTLLITCSDHGEMLGDLGAWGKSLPYEGACHIPLTVRFPRRLRPVMRSDFADLNDLLPTCCDAAGITPPAGAPGESLLLGPGAGRKDRSLQYVEHQTGCRRWIMVRNQQYKLVHWYSGREECFDLIADPGESRDLLRDPHPGTEQAVASATSELRRHLLALEERWGVAGCVSDGAFTRFPLEESTWLPGAKPLEWQFQYVFQGYPPAEQQAMNSECQEVLAAVAREPLSELSRLDLAFYLSAGGDAALVERITRDAAASGSDQPGT